MIPSQMSAALRGELQRVGDLAARADDAWAIPPTAGEFLHTFILAAAYRRGVEIGTSYGFSALWIGSAMALNGGHLTTIDIRPAKIRAAQATFRAAGLEHVIDARHGSAVDILPTIGGPIDVAFIDADKPNCRRYFDLLRPNLAPRAAVVTDNIETHRDELREYCEYLRNLPDFVSYGLLIGNGMEITVRRPPQE